MAEAMIASLIGTKVSDPHEIYASDISAERRMRLKQLYGINTYSKNKVIPGSATVLVLAVKPQDLGDALKEFAPLINDKHLVISIAAGKKLGFLQSLLPRARVVRVMPNLACTAAEGMSVFCVGASITPLDKATVNRLLSCLGKVLELPESHFDAVTALSGSGPAFFTYFLNLMVDAAVKEGLDPKEALLLAGQTMLGTSKLLMEKHLDPQELIKAVTSAKGTTAAGLEVLDHSDIARVVRDTLHAAARRSAELGA